MMSKTPCNAMYVKDNKVKDGKGNYYFIGDQIVYDKEMERMFPSTTHLRPDMKYEKEYEISINEARP